MTGPSKKPPRDQGYIPFGFAVDFLELLRERDDLVELLTYEDLPWEDDYDVRRNYPAEHRRWKESLRSGQRDPKKIYLLIQYDVDRTPDRSMELLAEHERLSIPANVMIFRRRIERRHLRDHGELLFADYPLDEELLDRMTKGGNCLVGYHSNAYEQALFDRPRAARIFERDVEELRGRFDIRFFSPHGGVRDPKGRTNNSLAIPESLRQSLRWVHNAHTVRFDGNYSDGGLNSPKRDPRERDLRDFVRSWKPGRRYRILLHPQYYRTPCKRNERLQVASWYREILECYQGAALGNAWRGVELG